MEYKEKKQGRYLRIKEQLSELLPKTNDKLARMSTIVALLHHKMDGFFWTGYYFIRDNNKLVVGPYQGPVACQELKYGTGVCWASVIRNETVIVEDVNEFPGHVACDARSKSEIVVPVRNDKGEIISVLDVDSSVYAKFDETDAAGLESIVDMIFRL